MVIWPRASPLPPAAMVTPAQGDPAGPEMQGSRALSPAGSGGDSPPSRAGVYNPRSEGGSRGTWDGTLLSTHCSRSFPGCWEPIARKGLVLPLASRWAVCWEHGHAWEMRAATGERPWHPASDAQDRGAGGTAGHEGSSTPSDRNPRRGSGKLGGLKAGRGWRRGESVKGAM